MGTKILKEYPWYCTSLSIEGSRAPLICLLERVLSIVSIVLSSNTEESETVGLGRVGVKEAALGFMLLLLLAASCSLAISGGGRNRS